MAVVVQVTEFEAVLGVLITVRRRSRRQKSEYRRPFVPTQVS